MNKTIGIIGGKGKMGQYFASFFKKNGYQVIISDTDTSLSNIELAKKVEVVVVSVPIGLTEKVIEEVAPYIKPEGLLMDLTSLKIIPMEAMRHTKASYLGAHPLFGPTNSIEGQMFILCKGQGDEWYEWFKKLLDENRVEVHEMNAQEHDDLMVYVQALSHFSDLVLADALSGSGIKIEQFLKYQSPPYRLKLNMMGRILNQSPNLYAQIQIQNPNSLRVMNQFKNIADAWIDIVKNKNVSRFEKRFEKISSYLGRYKKIAMEESDFLIEQMNRRKFADEADPIQCDVDQSYDVAALGPENSFSSLAAQNYAKEEKVYYAQSIGEVFDLVKEGKIKKGIVPIENKLTGSVAETAYHLFQSDLVIQEEYNMPIHHYLVTLDDIEPKKIKTIYSHIQPLRQCRRYLKNYFPVATLQSMPSTTTALNKLIGEADYSAAVICSRQAALANNMNIVAENIEDYAFNETRFLVVGKERLAKKAKKTSIAFYFSADAPGTLYQVLGEFSKSEMNMTKIESLANPDIPGGYVFHIDFEGDAREEKAKEMLARIKKLVKKLKILGSY